MNKKNNASLVVMPNPETMSQVDERQQNTRLPMPSSILHSINNKHSISKNAHLTSSHTASPSNAQTLSIPIRCNTSPSNAHARNALTPRAIHALPHAGTGTPPSRASRLIRIVGMEAVYPCKQVQDICQTNHAAQSSAHACTRDRCSGDGGGYRTHRSWSRRKCGSEGCVARGIG